MQVFIFHLASWLRTCRFSEPTFRPSEATKHWKNTVFRNFPTFSHTCIFSVPTFCISYLLSSDCLHVRVSSWLCFFLTVLFIVETLVSKLPSATATATSTPESYSCCCYYSLPSCLSVPSKCWCGTHTRSRATTTAILVAKKLT